MKSKSWRRLVGGSTTASMLIWLLPVAVWAAGTVQTSRAATPQAPPDYRFLHIEIHAVSTATVSGRGASGNAFGQIRAEASVPVRITDNGIINVVANDGIHAKASYSDADITFRNYVNPSYPSAPSISCNFHGAPNDVALFVDTYLNKPPHPILITIEGPSLDVLAKDTSKCSDGERFGGAFFLFAGTPGPSLTPKDADARIPPTKLLRLNRARTWKSYSVPKRWKIPVSVAFASTFPGLMVKGDCEWSIQVTLSRNR